MKVEVSIILSFILLLGAESLAQSSFNNAIDFDGNGDYANTLNDPFFPTTNGTLEAWVKVRSIILPENIQSIGKLLLLRMKNNGIREIFMFTLIMLQAC